MGSGISVPTPDPPVDIDPIKTRERCAREYWWLYDFKRLEFEVSPELIAKGATVPKMTPGDVTALTGVLNRISELTGAKAPQQTQISGPGGAPLIDFRRLTDEQLEALRETNDVRSLAIPALAAVAVAASGAGAGEAETEEAETSSEPHAP